MTDTDSRHAENRESSVICAGCGNGIIGAVTFTTDKKTWHRLCWQKARDNYYFEQTLEGESDDR